MRTFFNPYRWKSALHALLDGRPRHAVRLWRVTRLWSDDHFPGCPQHYDPDRECFGPADLCQFARENRRRYVRNWRGGRRVT